MDLFDSHTHLYDREAYEGANADVVKRAIEAGVTRMVMPNAELGAIAPLNDLAAQFPVNVRMAMGLHPTELTDDPFRALEIIEGEFAEGHPYVAVGEIGIDLYWDDTKGDIQQQVFDRQCRLALEQDLPVIIHCRNGLDETLEVLQGLPKLPQAVFHSFCGTVREAERIQELGDFHFGINGIVTFKNSDLRNSLPAIPDDRLMIETDSPYLAPHPKRGRTNESSFLPYIASHIADCKNVSVEEIAALTTENASRFFRWE